MNDGLKNCGLPLGGLGTGTVELRRDGYFHEWQIMNNRPWGTGPRADLFLDTCFFGMQVHGKGVNNSIILGLAPDRHPVHHGGGDYLNDPYIIPYQQHPASIDAEIRVPFINLKYDFNGSIPVDISMEAFSPFIPLDAKNSGLPLAFFTFSLKNRLSKSIEVSLFGALRNLVGYTDMNKPSRMVFGKSGVRPHILFTRDKLAARASDNGSMALGAFLSNRKAESSYALHLRSPRDIWDPLRQSGRLENIDISDICSHDETPVRSGLPFGTLCRTVKLPARAKTEVTFVLAWYYPNFWEAYYEPKGVKGKCVGTRYSEWFANAGEVFSYGARNFNKLRDQSREFMEVYYRSSFPRWLLDEVAAHFTTMTKSSWWDKRGRFAVYEGLGCCGLQTTDITYAGSFPIVQFFPELQKSQMLLSQSNIEIPGKMPHTMGSTFSCCNSDTRNRIDLNPQFIMLIWRDVLWTGDREYLRKMWPAIKDALEWYSDKVTNEDDLPVNVGKDTSYDQFPFKGVSAYVGFLHAGSLYAAASLADLAGEADLARKFRDRLTHILNKLDNQLWNGEYYSLCYDPVDGSRNEGVMTEQMCADWFIRQTDGMGLLNGTHVKSALRAILKYCSRPEGYVSNCAWPEGGAIEINREAPDQATAPWTGVEFALAAHLIMMGMEKQGLRVVKDIWDRYERAGLRFNHIECGGHYYRALSAWSVYLALTGFSMNTIDRSLTISVRRKPAEFLFCSSAAWGSIRTKPRGGLVEAVVRHGSLQLKQLNLKGTTARKVRVALNGGQVPCKVKKIPGGTAVEFDRVIKLTAGKVLKIVDGAHV